MEHVESLTNILLTGISAVTAALVFVVRILRQRSEKCERIRDEQNKQITEIVKELGEAKGVLSVMASCPHTECPIPHAMRLPFTLNKPKEK